MDECYLLPLHHTVAGGRHAVDAHVRGAMSVTDGDGESAKVCPDHFDGLVRSTRYGQALSLAFVGCFVLGPVRPNACKENIELFTRLLGILRTRARKGLRVFSRSNTRGWDT